MVEIWHIPDIWLLGQRRGYEEENFPNANASQLSRYLRRSREGGSPVLPQAFWIPASAGMTKMDFDCWLCPPVMAVPGNDAPGQMITLFCGGLFRNGLEDTATSNECQ